MSDSRLDNVAAAIHRAVFSTTGRTLSHNELVAAAQAAIDALGLTEERHTYEAFDTKAVSGGEGNMRYGGQITRSLGFRTRSRLVSVWREEPTADRLSRAHFPAIEATRELFGEEPTQCHTGPLEPEHYCAECGTYNPDSGDA